MKVKRNWLSVLMLMGVLILVVGVGLLVKPVVMRVGAMEKFPDRGVPRMNITLNGVSLDEINAGSKETKYEGNEVTVYEGDSVTLEVSGVRVKGRGNATWEWIPEKKPLSIKFQKKIDLFGLGKAKKWNLLANFMDESNMRNAIAFRISEMLEMEPSFSGRFIDLYVNNEYRGLYYLVGKVEISDVAVNINDSLGVLVELDNIYGELEEYNMKTNSGDVIAIKDVVSKDNAKMALNNVIDSLNELEYAIEQQDYEMVTELIDTQSFAKYFLLSEFIVNPDAYWTSFYMYKDGINDRIHAGPGWDFDFSFANRGWGNWLGERFYSPYETMIRKEEIKPIDFYEDNGFDIEQYNNSLKISRILYKLMGMKEFNEEVKSVYERTLKAKKDDLLGYITALDKQIKEAAISNEKLWERFSYSKEINGLLEWVSQRYDYMDTIYGSNW